MEIYYDDKGENPAIREVEVNASWIGKITPFFNNELRKKLLLVEGAEFYEVIMKEAKGFNTIHVIGHPLRASKTLLKG